MKIAYLSDFFPFSGFDTKFNTELLQKLRKSNEVDAYTYYFDNSSVPEINNYRKRFIKIDSHNEEAKQIIDLNNPVSYKSASKKILDDSPDLLITKYTSSAQNYSIGKIVKTLKNEGLYAICIFDDNNDSYEGIFSMMFLGFYLNQFDVILSASEALKQKLIKFNSKALIEVFEYPFFNDFGYHIDKYEAKRKLDFNELSKTILYPVPYNLEPEYDIFIDVLNKIPDDMRFIVILENEKTFEKMKHKISKSGQGHKVRLEYYSLFDSEISLFFEASDAALLLFNKPYKTSLISLCFNFNLPVISENHITGNEIIENANGGVITGKSNSDNVVSQITGFFNLAASANYSQNIKSTKENNQWEQLAEIINKKSRQTIL